MTARWARKTALTTTAASLAVVSVARSQSPPTVSSGIEALARRDIGAAMSLFRRAAQDSSPSARTAAEQWLGHLSWMVYADGPGASAHLDRALLSAGDSSAILVERARVLAFEHRYRDATRTAASAMVRTRDDERRGLAARALVGAAVDGAFAAIEARSSIADSIDEASVHAALDTLRDRVERFPGRTSDALALMDAGALRLDANAIREGWNSYFLFTDGSQKYPTQLPRGLMDSGLAEPAALWLEGQRHGRGNADERPNDIAALGRFEHALRLATNEFYRRASLGQAREGDLDRLINAKTRALWPRLRWETDIPPYYPAAVPRELAKRFNVVMSVDRPSGSVPELHFAHVIESSAVAPSTERPRPRGRFVVLDGVTSNGFDAWLLDGAGGRAGWVSGDTIFEMRTAFTERPFQEWLNLTRPGAIAGEIARIARDSAADLARVQRDSSGYLPGVADRLFRDGIKPIVDSLIGTRESAADQQAAFARILFDQLIQSTIVLHETRHLADTHIAGRQSSGVDAEFRAKIAEVSGAARPKLALAAIVHPNIGDPTAHGQANRRVMLGLIRWIRSNASSIAGYDSAGVPLVQLPLLSDAQLRSAFLSMRPAA